MATKSDLVPSKRFLPDVPANGGRRARLESAARVLQRPESEAAAGGDAEEKMQFNDSSKEKLGQIENDAMKRGMTHEAAIPRRDGAAQGYRRIIAGPLT